MKILQDINSKATYDSEFSNTTLEDIVAWLESTLIIVKYEYSNYIEDDGWCIGFYTRYSESFIANELKKLSLKDATIRVEVFEDERDAMIEVRKVKA
jgi:hypothetical protein